MMTRRKALATIGSALLAGATTIAIARTRGYDVPKDRAARLAVLSPWQFVVLSAIARRIAAPDVDDGSVPTIDDVDAVGFIDVYLTKLPEALRRDFLRLLAFVEHVAPVLSSLGAKKFGSRFSRLAAADQDRVLAWIESNDSGLLRGGFDGLKSCVFMGYYRDARTWKILSYAGPFVAASVP